MDIFDEIEELFKERYKEWEGVAQFGGSGARLRRLVDEMCWPEEKIEGEIRKCLLARFEDKFDEMLVTGPTSVWTLCPHHLLPCNFKVHIGYIPNGGVLGLSKFSRIAVVFGKAPIMQEQYTRELADCFWDNLKPEGVGVHVVGKHGCIGCRGVGQDIEVKTTTLLGSFKDDPTVREEFYKNIGR